MKYIQSNINILIILLAAGLISCEQESSYVEPVLDFEIQLTDSVAPASIYFLNKSVYAEQFEWDFGDGTTSSEKSAEHIFRDGGTYTITLRAWNDHEQFSTQRTISLSTVYQYVIVNNSQFGLYKLTSYSNDHTQDDLCCDHGLLEAFKASEKCRTMNENLYVSFENKEGQKFRTAFPFCLKEDILNELIIDKNTLVIVE